MRDEKLEFSEWCEKYGYNKTTSGNYIREGVRYSLDEVEFKYKYDLD